MSHVAHKLPQESDHTQKQRTLSASMQKALVSLGLEGVSLSKESLSILHLFDEGKISKEEALNRVIARVKSQTK